MLKKLKMLSIFLVFFFMLPIITGLLPFPNNQKYEPTINKENPVVYASSEVILTGQEEVAGEGTTTDVSSNLNSFNVLFVYTHSHETYKPFAESEIGKITVSDNKANIFSMSDMMENYFKLNGINATTLDVDIMEELTKQGKNYASAYKVARPFIKEALAEKPYDLVLDLHRDAAGYKTSTVKYNDVSYAKIAFVIGTAHSNFRENLKHANALNQSLNQIVPNISRGIIQKSSAQGDGVYNQDLGPHLLVVEVGGIDNNEDEVYRTISVLAQAIANTYLQKEDNV